jgi:hypothetical protein
MTSDRPGSQYSEFFRRLRARPLSSWSLDERATSARRTATQLAALAWTGEHPAEHPMPSVPDLGPHVIADQLEVLAVDAERAGADNAEVRRLMIGLAQKLSLRLD